MTAPAVDQDATSLVLAEIITATVQGEGPSCGRRCSFVRLGGCNLSCKWCDQPETWDAGRYDLRATLTRTPVGDIVRRALAAAPGLVVITGGEPLLHQQQEGWQDLLTALHTAGMEMEVETNGTIRPTPFTVERVTRFNCSPKLSSTGDPQSKRINPAALAALRWSGRACFKFVCTDESQVAQAAAVAAAHDIPPALVWIMPEGTTTEQLHHTLARIADPAIAAGFNLSTRLHVHTWGDEKGR